MHHTFFQAPVGQLLLEGQPRAPEPKNKIGLKIREAIVDLRHRAQVGPRVRFAAVRVPASVNVGLSVVCSASGLAPVVAHRETCRIAQLLQLSVTKDCLSS